MRRWQELLFHPKAEKVFLRVLGSAYVIYLLVFGYVMYAPSFLHWGHTVSIVDHVTDTNNVVAYWTPAAMQSATDADNAYMQDNTTSDTAQESSIASDSTTTQQQGVLPRGSSVPYPYSTVGKLFLTSGTGQNMVCSGTAIVSQNASTVDTAGHCLYWNGGWVRNVLFCPLYDNGTTPHGCWAARDLEVPSDWIERGPGNFYHDMGMIVVAPNDEGNLTDVVGGVGWAYNQPTTQTFYAYGYPAAYPFDGQTRQSCEERPSTTWRQSGGTVISIPCNMNGGSSGGPWFIQRNGNWYVNGHNDFISSLRFGHMFSPYYDDTWYELYQKAQHI